MPKIMAGFATVRITNKRELPKRATNDTAPNSNEGVRDANQSPTPTSWRAIGRKHELITCNVELIRPKDGAPAAPQLACLTKGSDPSIGSASGLEVG
jgi:hypothetical protein